MRRLLSDVAPQPGRTAVLGEPLELHPQVALRPEPFGALAYHYGNRRLVFLKHRDVVAVAQQLARHPSLAATLAACDIAPDRWPSFERAFESLSSSDIVRIRERVPSPAPEPVVEPDPVVEPEPARGTEAP